MFQFYIVSTLLLVSSVSASAIPQANQTWGCDDPFECAHTWAMNRRPLLRFDGAAGGHCFPDEATNANNGECRDLNEDAPIYYNIVRWTTSSWSGTCGTDTRRAAPRSGSTKDMTMTVR